MAKRISRRLGVSMSNAKRLVRTETAYIHELATLESYKEAGIIKYRYLTTLDNRTSEICQELDQNVFLVDDAMPGENFPPMHPNCRSTTEAVFEDEIESTRIARAEDGSQYMVPRNMCYEEWKEKYVDYIPQNVGISDGVKKYKKEEVRDIAQNVANMLSTYAMLRTNKWSGRIVFDNTDVQYGKLWSCDIATQEETAPYILMHEMLHAYSASHFSEKMFAVHWKIEEASVEYLNQLISEREGVTSVPSAYGDDVEKLRKIYKILGEYDEELDFALDLFNQNMPERIEWLINKVNNRILNSTNLDEIEELNSLFDLIEELE